MLDNVETDVAQIGVRLLDDAYLAWFSAEIECDTALQVWFQSIGAAREDRYLSYLAALGREEASARDLERLWQLSEPCRDTLAERVQGVSE
jgi:hypothetical protein